jgi:uncharacterized membrane protein YkoI
MTLKYKLVGAALAAALAFGGIAPVLAAEGTEANESQMNETQVLMNAKISIADAIRAAETEAKGKAVDSGLNDENGKASYQVEVLMPDGTRTDVFVDLETGKVISMAAADAGENGDGGEGAEGSEAGEQGGEAGENQTEGAN